MNILIQMPKEINHDLEVEIGAIIRVTMEQKPQETVYVHDTSGHLKNKYQIVKRNGGAIDYTIIVN